MRLKLEPRMLDKTTAAGYCGLSLTTFSAECPVKPQEFGTTKRYDRNELDAWLDQRSRGGKTTSKDEILRRLDAN